MTKTLDDALRAIPDRRRRARDDEAHAKNLEQLANQTSQQASQALKEGNRELYEKMMKHVKELLDKAKLARANDAADALDTSLSAIPDRRPRRPFTLRGGLDATLARRTARDTDFPHTINFGGETYYDTGKRGNNIKSGEESAEYESRDTDGERTGRRVWRTASGKIVRDSFGGLDATLARGRDDLAKSVTKAQLLQKIKDGDWEASTDVEPAIKNRTALEVREAETGKKFWVRVSDSALDRVSRAVAAIPDRRVTGDRLADALRRIPDRRRGSRDAEPRKRLYPSYTLTQLKEFVTSGKGNAKMEEEIAARESGASTLSVTPQILGGKVINKVGRL